MNLSVEPEPRKDDGLDGAELPRFEQLSLFGEDEPAAPAAGPVSSNTWEVTTVKAACARPPGAVRSTSAGAPEESLRAEEAQAGARGQKKVVRQKLSREERKKSRDKFLRWAEAIDAMLEERLQRTGKTREEMLLEILGSAPSAPPPGRRPGKRSRRKNAGPLQAAAPPRERDAVLQMGGASPQGGASAQGEAFAQNAGLRKPKDAAERKRMVAELKRRLAEGLAKELEKEPEKGPEKKPEKELKKEPEKALEGGPEGAPQNVPQSAPQSAPETFPKSASPARERLRPQGESQEERPPVKVTFFPEEDAAVLSLAESVVVFTCFRETLHFLAALLEREGLSVARLHGGMRRAEKEAQVQAFAGGARVLVSTETGSEGRNLQFCNVLVNYDLPWNPMRIEQRIGRLHRLGQTKDVYIYNLSAAGTVEAYILELLDAKINMFQLVVGELDMILGNLREKKDFEDIVMDIWAGAADEATLQAGLAELGEKLAAAKKHYLAVKELDDRLLGELLPEKD